MRITDHFAEKPLEIRVPVSRRAAEGTTGEEAALNSEHRLCLYAGDRLLHCFSCSPADLGALCAGWLLSEGYGGTALEISPDGKSARAEGVLDAPITPKRLACSAAAADTGEMLALFHAGSDGHARTHGIHECVLKGSGWSFCRTDIGRHNAIDKALGAALLAGCDLTGATLFTSGRIHTQTVEKAVRCGIGCLMSKAVITNEALALAQSLNLPVFFSVKESSYLAK